MKDQNDLYTLDLGDLMSPDPFTALIARLENHKKRTEETLAQINAQLIAARAASQAAQAKPAR